MIAPAGIPGCLQVALLSRVSCLSRPLQCVFARASNVLRASSERVSGVVARAAAEKSDGRAERAQGGLKRRRPDLQTGPMRCQKRTLCKC